jgi:hypothetical protein
VVVQDPTTVKVAAEKAPKPVAALSTSSHVASKEQEGTEGGGEEGAHVGLTQDKVRAMVKATVHEELHHELGRAVAHAVQKALKASHEHVLEHRGLETERAVDAEIARVESLIAQEEAAGHSPALR